MDSVIRESRKSASLHRNRYRAQLEDDRADFRSKLEEAGIEAEICESYSISFNGMSISGVSDDERRKIGNMSAVEEVHRNYVYEADLDYTHLISGTVL